MKRLSLLVVLVLMALALSVPSFAQTTMTTLQKVKLTVVAKNAAGAVIPIPPGSTMVLAVTSVPVSASPGTFTDMITVAEWSAFYNPVVAGVHTVAVALNVAGTTYNATLPITVTLGVVMPTTITIVAGVPVAR